ncbi:MAG: Uma2 family endonuclease [Anaerolineae bacterium]
MVKKFVNLNYSEASHSNPGNPEINTLLPGESDAHLNAILYLHQALRYAFKDVSQTYVGANLTLYFEEGNPDAQCTPDLFVVKGVPKHNRCNYKLWEEKAPPSAIFEITSRQSRVEDLGTKRGLYELLGVREYFVFDPLGEYLSPQLYAYHLVPAGHYQPLVLSSAGTLFSQELGLTFKVDGPLLRVIEPKTGVLIPTLEEAVSQGKKWLEQAQTEARRAEHAEEELVRLQTELDQLGRPFDHN